MANQQLVDYIISLNSNRHSKATIKRVLLEVGWPEKEVEDAFAIAELTRQELTPGILHDRAFIMQVLSVILLIIAGTSLIFNPAATGNAVLETPIIVEQVPTPLRLQEVTVIEEKHPIQTPEPEPQNATDSQPAEQPDERCELKTGIQKDECNLKKADDINDCNRISRADLRATCVQRLAITTADKALCNFLSDSDECHIAYAQAQNDPTACSRIANNEKRARCQG